MLTGPRRARERPCEMTDVLPAPATTLVIAEDEALIAEDIVHELERNGLVVLARARTADEAVEAVRRHEPSFVLLDIDLARGSSGIDAAERLAERDGRRCIFLSGRLDADTRERLLALRPIAILSKPLLTSQLLDVLAGAGEDLETSGPG